MGILDLGIAQQTVHDAVLEDFASHTQRCYEIRGNCDSFSDLSCLYSVSDVCTASDWECMNDTDCSSTSDGEDHYGDDLERAEQFLSFWETALEEDMLRKEEEVARCMTMLTEQHAKLLNMAKQLA